MAPLSSAAKQALHALPAVGLVPAEPSWSIGAARHRQVFAHLPHFHALLLHVDSRMDVRHCSQQQQQQQAGKGHHGCADASHIMGVLGAVILLSSMLASGWIFVAPPLSNHSLYSSSRSIWMPAWTPICSSAWRTTPHAAGSLVHTRTCVKSGAITAHSSRRTAVAPNMTTLPVAMLCHDVRGGTGGRCKYV